MVCQACGGPVGPDVKFCAHCGAQVLQQQTPPQHVPPPQYAAYPPPAYPPYPPMMVAPRVQRHLQTLGTLWCVYAAYRIVEGIIGMFFLRAFMYRRWNNGFPFGHGAPWMHLMPVIAGFTVMAAIFAVFVGYSLLTRKTWGRVLGIVAAVLVLFKVPFGTVLGIYTLWVLAPSTSGMEYDSIAEPS
ncbi:zinc ribbon domain-containing protein [Edaphobacter flagellatus]|uniref:zinc ribbon domain-containing protein n=1 Tax=Edaphobacter flagellatus TaxID=1933044 RepID=UPI0021B4C363|nr:zinc ribbon domain-containing protein [Edaphobacter flagellatus]